MICSFSSSLSFKLKLNGISLRNIAGDDLLKRVLLFFDPIQYFLYIHIFLLYMHSKVQLTTPVWDGH